MTVANTISYDFGKLGLHAGSLPITDAYQDTIRFLGDGDGDGVAEAYSYSLVQVPKYDKDGYVVSQDSGVYRTRDGKPPIAMDIKLSTLKFSYFNAAGDTTSNVANIKSVNVMLKINNTNIKTTAASMLFWTKTFYLN